MTVRTRADAPARTATRPARARAARTTAFDTRMMAAVEQLLEQGHRFNTLTVEHLTETAGMARATFYLHCRDKGELVGRLMQRLTREIVDSAGNWFRGGTEVNRATLHFALQGIVATFKRHQAVLSAIADTEGSDPLVAELHGRMMDELCGMSRRAINRVRRDGRAPAGAPPELAELLTWFVELYCVRFVADHDGRRLDRLVDAFAFVCARAIFADEQPR